MRSKRPRAADARRAELRYASPAAPGCRPVTRLRDTKLEKGYTMQGTIRQRITSALRAGAMGAALLGLGLSSGLAADAKGTWLTEGGKATVRIAACGDALCGTIIALKEPNDPDTGKPKTDKNNADPSQRSRPVIGSLIVLGMKPNGDNKWAGQVYNAEDGKTYTGSITLQNGNSLKLEGCILGGLICKAQAWTRGS
jgi:uncharacterized protein (DUF2147 family)